MPIRASDHSPCVQINEDFGSGGLYVFDRLLKLAASCIIKMISKALNRFSIEMNFELIAKPPHHCFGSEFAVDIFRSVNAKRELRPSGGGNEKENRRQGLSLTNGYFAIFPILGANLAQLAQIWHSENLFFG